VVFMKGTALMPMCGFSGVVCKIFELLNIPIRDINVLEDPELRQGIKDFTQWPTIPQVYVKGEFIGGADILKEMFQSGELQQLLQAKGLLAQPPHPEQNL
jgi:monothiol glutaredoxin